MDGSRPWRRRRVRKRDVSWGGVGLGAKVYKYMAIAIYVTWGDALKK
jgi:hypothetical protein